MDKNKFPVTLERVEELIAKSDASGQIVPPPNIKEIEPETETERKFFLNFWKDLPGFYTYYGTLCKYAEELKKEMEKSNENERGK